MREDRPGRRKRPRETSPSRSGIVLSVGTGNRWKGQGGFPNRKTRWSAHGLPDGKELGNKAGLFLTGGLPDGREKPVKGRCAKTKRNPSGK